MRSFILPLAFLIVSTGAHAAEPIEGNWKTESGETVTAAPCGNGICLTIKTGKHAGKQIGVLTGSGSNYAGTVTDPANDKTYAGSATVADKSLKLKGCALKILCKSQSWSRM